MEVNEKKMIFWCLLSENTEAAHKLTKLKKIVHKILQKFHESRVNKVLHNFY